LGVGQGWGGGVDNRGQGKAQKDFLHTMCTLPKYDKRQVRFFIGNLPFLLAYHGRDERI
jgi:hypothetical protein